MAARVLVVDDSPTIRKVVSTILESRGYEALTAADGQKALDLLATTEVELVLLDFVMPRMNGYQFCRVLREMKGGADLPVVLMSAKGDKIRGQFLQQTGAVEAITKPFDAKSLANVVETALKRRGKFRPGTNTPLPPGGEARMELLRPSRISLSDDPGLRRIQEAEEFGAALVRLLSPELASVPGVTPSLSEGLEGAILRTIRPEAYAALERLIKTLRFGEVAREALTGDLAVISVVELLQFLDMQRLSGALTVNSAEEEVTLYIEGGRLNYAGSSGLRDEFRLGRYLVEDGAISRGDLNNVLKNRAGSKRLLGETLVNLGMIHDDVLKKALFRQTSELVYEVARWRAGRFAFAVGAKSPIAAKAALNLETVALVMEAFRRVDEWRMIEGSFDLGEILDRDPAMIERLGKELRLSELEQAVLNAVDGARSVREILTMVEGSSYELSKVLHQLLGSRLLRRKVA
jgi:CheY-like chemotaxis protein